MRYPPPEPGELRNLTLRNALIVLVSPSSNKSPYARAKPTSAIGPFTTRAAPLPSVRAFQILRSLSYEIDLPSPDSTTLRPPPFVVCSGSPAPARIRHISLPAGPLRSEIDPPAVVRLLHLSRAGRVAGRSCFVVQLLHGLYGTQATSKKTVRAFRRLLICTTTVCGPVS